MKEEHTTFLDFGAQKGDPIWHDGVRCFVFADGSTSDGITHRIPPTNERELVVLRERFIVTKRKLLQETIRQFFASKTPELAARIGQLERELTEEESDFENELLIACRGVWRQVQHERLDRLVNRR
jgi:hypothetical protein